MKCLLVRDLYLSSVDTIDNIMWGLSLNCASYALCSAQDLLHTTRQFLGQRLGLHCPRDVDDFIKWNVATVLDVLLLLPVSWGLCKSEATWPDTSRGEGTFESTDNKRGGRGHY